MGRHGLNLSGSGYGNSEMNLPVPKNAANFLTS